MDLTMYKTSLTKAARSLGESDHCPTPPDHPSTSPSVIELQVAPLVAGVDNAAFDKTHERDIDSKGNDVTSFRRNDQQRSSKKSLEMPCTKYCTPKNADRFASAGTDNPSFVNDVEDEKLRSAFEKSLASIKSKSGGGQIASLVSVEDEVNGVCHDKGINTEVVIHPRSELHKSYSLGCLMYHFESPREETVTGTSLVRSESLDMCLQPDPGVLCRWSPLSNSSECWHPEPPVESSVVIGDVSVNPMPKRKLPVRAQSTLSSCSSWRSDAHICRICWFSEDRGESCIQPCHCSGSSAYVHPSCLAKWLSVAQVYKCEICLFNFSTRRKMKPLRQWRWKLDKTRQKSQLEATVILLAIVTPPLICGIILCSQKIMEFLEQTEQTWASTGMPLALMTLVLASTLTYLVAMVYFLRKLGSVCRQWVRSNETVTVRLGDLEQIIEPGKDDQSVWTIT